MVEYKELLKTMFSNNFDDLENTLNMLRKK